MDKKCSELIEISRFPLIVGVVFIHVYSNAVIVGGDELATNADFSTLWFQYLFSQIFSRVAVPIFFFISAYLLYSEGRMTSLQIWGKWKKRVHSLLIPYLFWNLVVLLVQLVGQNVAITSRFFSRGQWNVAEMGWYQYADALFGFDQGPIDYPLWFIRDLMLLVVLSPVLYILIRKSRCVLLIFPFLLWVGFAGGFNFYISRAALLFFCLGLAFSGVNFTQWLGNRLGDAISFIYLGLACVEAYWVTAGADAFWLHRFNVLIGCYVFLHIALRLLEYSCCSRLLRFLAAASFFIYLAHGCLLQVFKKLLYMGLQPSSDLQIIFVYFAAPMMTISVLLIIYFYVIQKLPLWFRAIVLGTKKVI